LDIKNQLPKERPHGVESLVEVEDDVFSIRFLATTFDRQPVSCLTAVPILWRPNILVLHRQAQAFLWGVRVTGTCKVPVTFTLPGIALDAKTSDGLLPSIQY
jgi:hypothetical protein